MILLQKLTCIPQKHYRLQGFSSLACNSRGQGCHGYRPIHCNSASVRVWKSLKCLEMEGPPATGRSQPLPYLRGWYLSGTSAQSLQLLCQVRQPSLARLHLSVPLHTKALHTAESKKPLADDSQAMHNRWVFSKCSINTHLCGPGSAWRLKQMLITVSAKFVDIRNQFRWLQTGVLDSRGWI